MPIWNWMEMHRTGNADFLIKTRRKLHNDPWSAWRKLLNQFYARFGMTPAFREHLRKMRTYTILTCENAMKFDTVKKIKIDVLEQELSKFTDKTADVDFFENVAQMSKFVGYRVDPKRMSVAEYQANLKLMERAARQFNLSKNRHGRKGNERSGS